MFGDETNKTGLKDPDSDIEAEGQDADNDQDLDIDGDGESLGDDSDQDPDGDIDGESLSTDGDADHEEDDGDDGDDEGLSLEDFEGEPEPEEKSSGVQRRIDRLTAELKSEREKREALEAKVENPPSKTDKPKFSRQQLVKAIEDGIDKGDSNIIMEVLEYMTDDVKTSLREEYTSERTKAQKVQEQRTQEWTTLVGDYSYLWDEDEPEMYRGARRDLDLRNPESILKKLANQIYLDPKKAKTYQVAGGQRLAVADALNKILHKRKISPKGKETERLKKRLAKEKRKSALSTSKSSKKSEFVNRGPSTPKQRLNDYLKERKQMKSAAMTK